MRKDVKAGMVLAMFVVILAGWYYTRDDSSQSAIPLEPVAKAPTEGTRTLHDASQSAPPIERATRDAGHTTVPLRSQREAARRDSRHAAQPATADRAHVRSGKVDGDEVPRAPGRRTRAVDELEALEFYTVQPRDTLAGLAKVYYGDRQHAALILRANPRIQNPDLLRVGMVLRLPAIPTVDVLATRSGGRTQDVTPRAEEVPPRNVGRASTPVQSNPPARTYTVKSGDSFYAIADRLLGSGARWPEILKLNRALVKGDPKRLQPGMKLRLPAD